MERNAPPAREAGCVAPGCTARVVKLVDTRDLKSLGAIRAGSTQAVNDPREAPRPIPVMWMMCARAPPRPASVGAMFRGIGDGDADAGRGHGTKPAAPQRGSRARGPVRAVAGFRHGNRAGREGGHRLSRRRTPDRPLPPARLIHGKGGWTALPAPQASSWILTNRVTKSLSLLTTAMWLATPVVKSATHRKPGAHNSN